MLCLKTVLCIKLLSKLCLFKKAHSCAINYFSCCCSPSGWLAIIISDHRSSCSSSSYDSLPRPEQPGRQQLKRIYLAAVAAAAEAKQLEQHVINP